MIPSYSHALIIGAGAGLSAAFARRVAEGGLRVSLAARQTGKLAALADQLNAATFPVEANSRASLEQLFEAVEAAGGAPDVVLYNPSARLPGSLLEVDASKLEQAIAVTAIGGFHTAQLAARRMLPNRHGALLFTGATASVKAYGRSTAFAMGKFALRALAQSLARELHPQGIHVGHFVIDGGIRNPARPDHVEPADAPDSMLDPDAIAEVYWQHLRQDRSIWSWEVELRPWVERF